MAIYFKFKSAKDYDSIPVDGPFIAVGNLKEKIFEFKHLGKGTDFDLVVSNPQTDEEYLDELYLLRKNTSVLVRRVPGKPQKPIVTEREEPKPSESGGEKSSQVKNGFQIPSSSQMNYLEEPEWDEFGNDLYAIPETSHVQPTQVSEPALNIADEESRIKAHISMTDSDWQRKLQEASNAGRGFRRGAGGRGIAGRGFGRGMMESKTPPQGYVCHRCRVSGHFIQHCPTNGDPNYDIKKVKLPTGIPKSMLVANPDGSYALPSGAVAVLRPNEADFEKEIEGLPTTRSVTELPPELRCPLCKQVLKDAVFTSKCCYESFCDKCIREYIITNSRCVCGRGDVLADDLLPNKRLRETVSRILETRAPNSTDNNAGSAKVQDVESQFPQPKAPSPTLSAAVKEELLATPPNHVAEVLNDPVTEGLVTVPEAPLKSIDKNKTISNVDQPEATFVTTVSMRDQISQGSAPQVDEEVQERASTGETGKKKKKKKVKQPLPLNSMDMQWRGPQDFGFDGSMMPFVPPGYNTFWPGMQAPMDGFMPNYGFGAPYMGYAPSPFDMPFNPMMQQDLAAATYMMPGVPPQGDYRMGPNPIMHPMPPVMTREEFEARKADLRRRKESERRRERESSRDREFSRDGGDDGSTTRKKPRLPPKATGVDRDEGIASPIPPRRAESPTISKRNDHNDNVAVDAKAMDRKMKGSVFSRISFPEIRAEKKSHASSSSHRDRASTHSSTRSHHDHGVKVSRKSSQDHDHDEDVHPRRRGSSSRYEADEREQAAQTRSREREHGHSHERPREREREHVSRHK